MQVEWLIGRVASGDFEDELSRCWGHCRREYVRRWAREPECAMEIDWVVARVVEELRSLPPSVGRMRLVEEWAPHVADKLKELCASPRAGAAKLPLVLSTLIHHELKGLLMGSPRTMGEFRNWLRSDSAVESVIAHSRLLIRRGKGWRVTSLGQAYSLDWGPYAGLAFVLDQLAVVKSNGIEQVIRAALGDRLVTMKASLPVLTKRPGVDLEGSRPMIREIRDLLKAIQTVTDQVRTEVIQQLVAD